MERENANKKIRQRHAEAYEKPSVHEVVPATQTWCDIIVCVVGVDYNPGCNPYYQ